MANSSSGPLPLDPKAFNEAGEKVEVLQTHIGWVYLVGEHAYKLKKPVKFDFLDFTSLDRRKWACERELSLNRRLCPDLYLGILPVVQLSDGKRQIVSASETPPEDSQIVDWAVWMRRLPADRMLDHLLVKDRVSVTDVEKIADTLAEFYLRQRKDAPVKPGGLGDLEAVTFNVDENLREGRSLDPQILSFDSLALIHNRARHFLKKFGDIIRERVRAGFVVDGHGDLRAENVCLPENAPPLLFDCIEFNDRFRINDTALDAAFLAMDFDSRGRTDLSRAFLARYQERCDPQIPSRLLNFYLGYRAFIKGKVAAWIAADKNVGEDQKSASRKQGRVLFDLSVRYALSDERILLVFCGVAGSGKSTLASAFTKRLNCPHIATDLLRDEIVPRSAPLEQRYSSNALARVYELLYSRAADLISGVSNPERLAIVDGTFTSRSNRKRIVEVARQHGATCVLVWADSSPDAIEKHFADRARQDHVFGSEARLEISRRQQSNFEIPQDSEGFHGIVRVDTSRDIAESKSSAWDGVMSVLARSLVD